MKFASYIGIVEKECLVLDIDTLSLKAIDVLCNEFFTEILIGLMVYYQNRYYY